MQNDTSVASVIASRIPGAAREAGRQLLVACGVVCCAAVCLAMPFVLIVAMHADQVSMIARAVGLEGSLPLDTFRWPDRAVEAVEYAFNLYAFWATRTALFNLLAVGGFVIVAMPAINSHGRLSGLRYAAICVSCQFIFRLSLAALHLRGVLDLEGGWKPLCLHVAFELVFWGPFVARMMQLAWGLKNGTPLFLLFAASTFLYNGFQAVYYLYFQIEAPALRAFFGCFLVHIISQTTFELYVRTMTALLDQEQNVVSGLLLLCIPASFQAAMHAMFQLSFPGFVGGVALEVFGCFLELSSKLALRRGMTPFERCVKVLKMLRQKSSDDPPASSFEGVVPAVAWSPAAEGGAASYSPHVAQVRRAGVLRMSVMVGNLCELITHLLTAILLLTLQLNPNDGCGAPAIPRSRVVGLFAIKLTFELITDVAISSIDSITTCREGPDSPHLHFSSAGSPGCVAVGLICVSMVMDLTSSSVMIMCPCPPSEGSFETSALARCPVDALMFGT
eukprot:TRINITY_DN34636_c0_g1_i1.p1 TRINITY_DN34636_c0_g1~~TRINITY_DN34636_c0_g1_i1.p1  ORF type:complete len:505 (+),score=12.82 TRINITY_DN34636_c0_g1_i1:70-1584(+)